MAKWKVGDVVKHKSTGDSLLILHVREEGENGFCVKAMPQIYVVRLPNYQRAELNEYELEPIRVDAKIKDLRD